MTQRSPRRWSFQRATPIDFVLYVYVAAALIGLIICGLAYAINPFWMPYGQALLAPFLMLLLWFGALLCWTLVVHAVWYVMRAAFGDRRRLTASRFAPRSIESSITMKNILLQLDPDAHASSFDAVVAVDSGVDHLVQYANVSVDDVEGLIHGAMFTRGPQDLKHTAVFIGGSNVATGEAILEKVTKTFFGPLSVSVMLDANGANTTAAAAVIAAGRHLSLSGITATILAGTGPVGQRVARLLAGEGADVRLGSRKQVRADEAATAINQRLSESAANPGHVVGIETYDHDGLVESVQGVDLVVAAGAAGIELLPLDVRQQVSSIKVMIDLNAVPPEGIAGVGIADKAKDVDGITAYGAIGVGGTKMKIHRAAVAKLFASNDCVLDAEEVYALGKAL